MNDDKPKSLMVLNRNVLVGCSNMSYEKGMAIIDPVTMPRPTEETSRSYIKYGRAFLCYTQMVVNR